MKKVLIVGSGGREHALAWQVSKSKMVSQVYICPGNGGADMTPGIQNVPNMAQTELLDFVQKEGIDLTIVGPEQPLSEGIVDLFESKKQAIFGPCKSAAQLESSKYFAKEFMLEAGIPTAGFEIFDHPSSAHAYLEICEFPCVIKANGLAAGKGVVVAASKKEAHQAVEDFLVKKVFGYSGEQIIIEDFIRGLEVSFMVMSDGHCIMPLATSQDYKRLLDGAHGPNTGGMGALSPTSRIDRDLSEFIMKKVMYPVLEKMRDRGTLYKGFLYAGIMIQPDGSVRVLEFNCRLGDPETQPIMLRLKTSLVDLVEAALLGNLDSVQADWDERFSVGVVLAAEGYPTSPKTGDAIHGVPICDYSSTRQVFHAGTKLENNELFVSGGRVLCATALGETLETARSEAYELASCIHFSGKQYRKDIAE